MSARLGVKLTQQALLSLASVPGPGAGGLPASGPALQGGFDLRALPWQRCGSLTAEGGGLGLGMGVSVVPESSAPPLC